MNDRIRAETEALLGRSALRRATAFLCVPLALDAALYAASFRLCGDRLAAAFVAKTALIVVAFAVLFAGMAVIPRIGRIPPLWAYSMRMLLAAMIVGLLGVVFGMGSALVAVVAERGGRVWLAVAMVAMFAAGVLAFLRFFAAGAFKLGGPAAIALASADALVLARLGYAAHPMIEALVAGTAALVCLAVLAAFPESDRPGPSG